MAIRIAVPLTTRPASTSCLNELRARYGIATDVRRYRPEHGDPVEPVLILGKGKWHPDTSRNPVKSTPR